MSIRNKEEVEFICQTIIDVYGDAADSLSYTKGDLLCKKVEGQWVCKKMIKDPNYKGNRYIWEEEVCQ